MNQYTLSHSRLRLTVSAALLGFEMGEERTWLGEPELAPTVSKTISEEAPFSKNVFTKTLLAFPTSCQTSCQSSLTWA
jgi:hypothetical protein